MNFLFGPFCCFRNIGRFYCCCVCLLVYLGHNKYLLSFTIKSICCNFLRWALQSSSPLTITAMMKRRKRRRQRQSAPSSFTIIARQASNNDSSFGQLLSIHNILHCIYHHRIYLAGCIINVSIIIISMEKNEFHIYFLFFFSKISHYQYSTFHHCAHRNEYGQTHIASKSKMIFLFKKNSQQN